MNLALHCPLHQLKVEWSPKIDQKVCLNMVKKGQLRAIALIKGK